MKRRTSSLLTAFALVSGDGRLGAGGRAGAGCAERYETSARVFGEFSLTYLVGVASGSTFADALTGAAYLANVQQPLLLTDPDNLPDPIGGYFDAMGKQAGVAYVNVFGGPKAISDKVYQQITDAAHTGGYTP